jgi:CubicO group peptidase (beta-lactamase class C family)
MGLHYDEIKVLCDEKHPYDEGMLRRVGKAHTRFNRIEDVRLMFECLDVNGVFKVKSEDDFIAKKRNDFNMPSLSVLVFNKGKIVARGVDGASRDSKYHLGSCTKAMTAMLCAKLTESGSLSFEDSITDYFPTAKKTAWSDVTIRHLMCHESGLLKDMDPKLWSYMWKKTNQTDQRPVRQYVCNKLLETPPSKGKGTYVYSNSNFIMLGAILEKVQKTTWENIIQNEIFKQLDMTGYGFGNPARIDKKHGLSGHRRRKDSLVNEQVKIGPGDDNPSSLGPAGTVHCTLESWFKFVMCCISDDKLIISAKTRNDLYKLMNGTYAGGWVQCNRTWADGLTLTHDGSNTMNHAIAWVSVKKKAGVLICTNISYDKIDSDLDSVVSEMIRKYIDS